MTGAARLIPIEQRLLTRREIDDADCWLYTGFIHPEGYGRIGYQGRSSTLVHRVAFEIWRGPIPEGLTVDHLCHTFDDTCPGGPRCSHRRCFNPDHLELVTAVENTTRGRSFSSVNRAKTHCKRGHALTPDNLYRSRSNPRSRYCKTCALLRSRKELV